jgi:deazaflavin-dependent oxidoreductase (nitroreductase family)
MHSFEHPCKVFVRWAVHSELTGQGAGVDYSLREEILSAQQQVAAFQKPSAGEAFFNRVFGFLVGLGIGPAYIYQLHVRGRKSGRVYALPVNIMDIGGKKILVAPRGKTQWVRNAEASGEITLKRGGYRQKFGLRAMSDQEKLAYLKEYLDRYASVVQRYFSVKAGSPAEAFRAVAAHYPVFELVQK